MHGMGFTACFARFAGYFGGADDRRVIGFGNGFGVAVAVGDDNILAGNVCRTDLGQGLSVMNGSKESSSRHRKV